ncbi:hypothetical protein E2C01_101025 [Portunus trituberculatus]|uniref:Uncharacterized protein n=1 Tax=Portunus trituberculatus TaxID=210409 RepID=A0A5B7K8H4_PORTR|nr:hypothetical protein [Portunus trituberculatus]
MEKKEGGFEGKKEASGGRKRDRLEEGGGRKVASLLLGNMILGSHASSTPNSIHINLHLPEVRQCRVGAFLSAATPFSSNSRLRHITTAK